MGNKHFSSRAISTLLADSAFRSWTKNSSSSCPFQDEVKETEQATPNLRPRCNAVILSVMARGVVLCSTCWACPLPHWEQSDSIASPTPLCLCLQAASRLWTLLSTVLLVGWQPQSRFYTGVYGIATIPYISHNILPFTDLVLGLPELSHYSVPGTPKLCAATLIGSNLHWRFRENNSNSYLLQ